MFIVQSILTTSMNFNKKDVIVGLVIIVAIIGGVLLYKKLKTSKPLSTQTPVSVTFREDFDAEGGYLDFIKNNIPDDVISIELKDISGGDSRGIATETEVLVDANDPESGCFYQGWLEKDGNLISIGKLQMAKGGWLLNYGPRSEGFNKIVVSLEKLFDNKIEKRILEGSF